MSRRDWAKVSVLLALLVTTSVAVELSAAWPVL
jgi:hypothetical protein